MYCILHITVTDETTSSGLSPDTVASQVLRAVETGSDEIFPATITQRLAIVLRAVWPRLLFFILARRAKKQYKDMIRNKLKQS